MQTVILPKGTVVKFRGFPCELTEDTTVESSAIAGMGLEAFLQSTEKGHSEVTTSTEENHS